MLHRITTLLAALLLATAMVHSAPVSNPIISKAPNDPLAEKIAADADFQNYYSLTVTFMNKVVETKSQSLFKKLIANTLTKDEETQLLKQLNYESREELDKAGAGIMKVAKISLLKFPELNNFTEDIRKEKISESVKLYAGSKNAPKFISANNEVNCFALMIACISACSLGCFYDSEYEKCFWRCTGLCLVESGLCWFATE